MRSIQELNRRRLELGLTYADLSEKSGVPVPTLQKVLSGKTPSPRFSTLHKLEQTLFTEQSPTILADSSAVKKRYNHAAPGKNTAFLYKNRKAQGTFTVSDYEQFPEEERYELIDGVLIRMEAPSMVHQTLLLYLARKFYDLAEGEDCRCAVFCAPCDVQLDGDDRTMVQPDVFIYCDLDKLTRKRGIGAPDLCVEILSASTRSKDQLLKYYKYKRAGVREFWVVDPEYRQIMVHLFGTEFGEEEGTHLYSFEDKVPVHICGDGNEIDFSKSIPEYLKGRLLEE